MDELVSALASVKRVLFSLGRRSFWHFLGRISGNDPVTVISYILFILL